ncbi:MAG: SIR2 family NAD-dependent protein deacylase [Planctomycetota bacterium]|jgi:NAD-dependent deacetylase
MIRIRDFERVVFFTGAGLSAESGIPTYRGKGGIWAEYDYTEFACQRAFDRDPEKVWDFHDKRRGAVGACEPNAGHAIVAAHPSATVVTQNIDGLHQRAGSEDVIELHGSLWRVRCEACGATEVNTDVPIESRTCACGAHWRPGIVWFEDMLDPATIAAAESACARCDLLVSVGTSGVVFPAAGLPRVALEAGATLVEINPEETVVSAWYHHHLRGPASEMLQSLVGPPVR